jgi:CheY-like chemotaxis protein
MDIRLKGEGDGIDAARAIQGRLGIPVVFLTANADRRTYERALTTEHFGFVVKPFLERDLRIVLDTALSRAASTRRLTSALADEHALNEMIFSAAPVAMAVVDRDGVIHHCNERMRVLLGLPELASTRRGAASHDHINHSTRHVTRRAPHVVGELWSRLNDEPERTAAQEFVIHAPDGTAQHVLGTAVRLPDRAGPAPMLLLCCHTVDQRKRLMVDQLTREAEAVADHLLPSTAMLPKRVLLVEDDASIRAVLARLLRREGMLVTDAADGLQAWAVLSNLGHSGPERTPPFDVVLTDIVMPHLDGASLAQRVRAQYPRLPVLFMSGYFDEARLEGFSGPDAPPILRKPFRQTELLLALSQAHLA